MEQPSMAQYCGVATTTETGCYEPHVRKAKVFKFRSQPYPDVQSCIGNKAGTYHDREWWFATGKARQDFKAVEQDILRQLNTELREEYSVALQFNLFMIGRDQSSAKPTIMFFCQEKKPRKRAKQILEDGGLLKRLPGFKIGHQAEQPVVRSLIQPATRDSTPNTERTGKGILCADVYYDPSRHVRALATPIFINHGNQIWRRANAYAVVKDGHVVLMTVAHIFKTASSNSDDVPEDYDSDYDFGSDTDSVVDTGEQIKSLSLAEASVSNDPSDFYRADDPRSDLSSQSTKTTRPREAPTGTHTNALRVLGTLAQISIDQDWAVIEITNDDVTSALRADETISAPSSILSSARNTAVTLCALENSSGVLAESTTYIRLPGSFTFQEVYQVDLSGPVDWGDCGTLALDAVTQNVFGHIIASSQDMRTVFFMSIAITLRSSGTTWREITQAAIIESPGLAQKGSIKAKVLESRDSARKGSTRAIVPESTGLEWKPSLQASPGNHQTQPPFIFKIDEIREHPDIRPSCTTSGHWIPSTSTGYNYRSGGGVSSTWWYNQKDRIRSVPVQSLPQPLNHFKTFSVFYSSGRGFWVLRGDGTVPDPYESWMPLRFEPVADGSSSLIPAGASDTLQCQRPDQHWPHKLLPNVYHGPFTQNPNHGGLRGELPIFLALVAMSMDPANLPQWLPWMYQGSRWHAHTLDHGWKHKRGVVVSVYTCPVAWAGGSTTQDLTNLEDGAYGKYFD